MAPPGEPGRVHRPLRAAPEEDPVPPGGVTGQARSGRQFPDRFPTRFSRSRVLRFRDPAQTAGREGMTPGGLEPPASGLGTRSSGHRVRHDAAQGIRQNRKSTGRFAPPTGFPLLQNVGRFPSSPTGCRVSIDTTTDTIFRTTRPGEFAPLFRIVDLGDYRLAKSQSPVSSPS